MAKGYIIGHVSIHDVEAYKAYAANNDKLAPAFEGRFLARGGTSEVVEGECLPRHVILEFPTYAQAKAFYDSPGYQENLKIRQANADSVIVLLEGVT